MHESEQGQVSRTAAQVYEEFFVPALFGQWAGRVADAAQIEPGQHVLDVACGTGVLARAAAARVGAAGSVVGLDINPGMLAVAEQTAPQVDWRQAPAETMPFSQASFDAVVSQFGLMFFADRRAAIQEMARVLRPGGRLAVAVWDRLEQSPGYAAMLVLLRRLFGDAAAASLRAPFALGDVSTLRALFREAGLADARITTAAGTARFPSLNAWVYTEIRGWTLADAIDDDQYARLLAAAETELQPFVAADGTVAFDAPAHIVTIQC